MTDPRTCITPNEKLHEAKRLVDKYRIGEEPKGTTKEQIKYAMKLYTSAFHPDSGELQNFAGRMSFQVSGFGLLKSIWNFYSIPVYIYLISIFDINWFPVFIVYTIYSIKMAFKNHYF